jgi:two-component system response regulator AtoC
MRALIRADWPGNVRQLENVIERSMLMAEGDRIRVADLPGDLEESPRADAETAELSIKKRVAALERELIVAALSRTEGNRSQAARLLEISYKALVYKIRDYGIDA